MSALNNEVLTFIMGKMKVRTLIMGKIMVRTGPSFYSYPAGRRFRATVQFFPMQN